MKKFPNALVIMLGAILTAWVLTYLIPSGSYERVTDTVTNQTSVVGDSYHQSDIEPPGVFELLLSVPEGLVNRAELIVLILLAGGSFYIIEKTGALGQALEFIVSLLQGKEEIGIAVLSLLFAAAGASIGLQEEIIAMAPILILFCRSMGFNVFVAVGASYGSAVLGAAFSPMNPFAVLLAQKEAQLLLLSGSGFRLVFLGLAILLWVVYLLYYGNRNRVDKKPMETSGGSMSFGTVLILILLCLTFSMVTYGLLELDWGFNELSACFFALGILSGLISRMGINATTLTYLEGMKEMTFAAIIMGLASSISLLLENGGVMDTIIHGLFTPMENLPASLSALGMMGSQALLHFPISSYSGQAVLTMPILTPLSDLVGVSRQVCVLAYQYGAVNMDFIVPTNGALMAILAVAGIPYNKWVRFIWKPLFFVFSLAAIALVVAVLIEY